MYMYMSPNIMGETICNLAITRTDHTLPSIVKLESNRLNCLSIILSRINISENA